MRARETKSNWSEVEGSADFLVFRDQNLSDIYRIMSDTMSSSSYTYDDHQDDAQQMAEFELVNQFVCVGDTRGDEAGIRTGVSVHFNPMTLDVERAERPNIKSIRVGPTPEFVPPHVNGDQDFGGHGPKVDVTARIEIRNTREIWTHDLDASTGNSKRLDGGARVDELHAL
jgi:hypothetical protein